MTIISLHLTGSTKCDGQKYIHNEMNKGRFLQAKNLYLVRDPKNPVDTNAVQVWYDDNGEKVRLGFVQRDQAPAVAVCLDEGGEVCPIDLMICGSSDSNYGLYFRVQMFCYSELEPPDYDIDIPDDCDWEI